MNCVTKNPVNCDNLRKMTINQINPDKSKTTVVIYFDVETGEQVSETDAQQCLNIQALEFTCAVVCQSTV